MRKRYAHNGGTAPIFVGGSMIAPGTGREIDEAMLPPEEGASPPEEPPPPDPDANLRDVLKGNSKSVIATLADSSDATLAGLARLEGESDTPRKGVMSAIAELQLQRAHLKSGGEAPT